MNHTNQFFVIGGSLHADTPSYIHRRADNELYEALMQGEFCYILTSRQMGKSSLTVRTTLRLQAVGVRAVVLDLTALGQNVGAEQWYYGMLARLAERLDLEEAADAFWLSQERLGPLQRFMAALRQVVLPGCSDRLVLFVDEIDVVRSLPFSTDEFFAAIRELYNRRTEDPELKRLTFCLLGVAAPTDLIRDTRLTPFNIGRRIELSDFTEKEAAPLALGLDPLELASIPKEATPFRKFMRRIIHWTGGHPYLTQRLSLAVAQEIERRPGGIGSRDVDRLCEDLFLSHRAQERDDNLIFVRERILRSEANPTPLLELYGAVRSGGHVGDDDTNGLVSLLRLSGIAKVRQGRLVVRNRIYEQVFDRRWIRIHMPDAELQRQKVAYRRGLARAASLAAVVVVAMAALAVTAANNARLRLAEANRARQIAISLRRNLYAADLSSSQSALEDDNVGLARGLLDAYRPNRGQEDLRTFEWNYLWGLCRDRSLWTFKVSHGTAHMAVSPDGRTLAIGTNGGVRLFDTGTHREFEGPPPISGRYVSAVAYSPDGRTLAVQCASEEAEVILWDVTARREVGRIKNHGSLFQNIAISPDSRVLAETSNRKEPDATVKLWNIHPLRKLGEYPGRAFVAFSPDGKTLATISLVNPNRFAPTGDVALFNLTTRQETLLRGPATADVNCVGFSPDGGRLAAGYGDGQMRVWDAASGRALPAPVGHRAWIYSVAYSRNGMLLASGSLDSTVKLWDPKTGTALGTLRGHDTGIGCMAFSSDGTMLASASNDTVKLWSVTTNGPPPTVNRPPSALSHDGKLEAGGGIGPRPNELTLRETATERVIGHLEPTAGYQHPVGFSANSERLYVVRDHRGADTMRSVPMARSVIAWDLHTSREVGRIPFGPGDFAKDFCRLSPNGRLLAVSGWMDGGPVQVFDLAAMRAVRRIPGSRSAFSPDSRLVAIAAVQAEEIRIYDTTTWRDLGRPLRTKVSQMIFSPNGRQVVVGTTDGLIQVWDLASRAIVKEYRAHTSGIGSLALSPDGQTLVTGAGASILKLWNTRTWRQTIALPVSVSGPGYTYFSPDGHTLYTCTGSNTMLIYRAPASAETSAAIGQ